MALATGNSVVSPLLSAGLGETVCLVSGQLHLTAVAWDPFGFFLL